MGKIILVTGGANSGKSEFAEKICRDLKGKTAYIATSKVHDQEMEEKRKKHIERRKKYSWETIEEYKGLSKIIDSKKDTKTYLLDCMTMLISNFMFEDNMDFNANNPEECSKIQEEIEEELENLIKSVKNKNVNCIIVSNELGMGIVAESKLNRFYADMVGRANKKMSEYADDVYLVISGIEIKLK